MMDFNLILLLTGLGLLVVVILFALWGFLGGLKRELSCIAVFIVLLVLSWLVFGDSATLLNVKAGQQVAELLGIQDGSISTIWDAVLVYAKAQIPNGEILLVEGKETYALFYSIVSTICHAFGLFVGTIGVLIICPIIRFITHIVWLIIRAVKKSKVNKNPTAEKIAEEKENKKEMVVIPSSIEGEEAVLTKDENIFEEKTEGKKRLWGALAGALKGVFVVIMVCAPLSGLSSMINSATPETKKLLKDVVNGDAKIQVSQSSDDPIDMIFEFAEVYEDSALGKFANGSRFFFGKSFSEQMFDSLLKMETKNQTIYLSEEIKTFIEAANRLNGKVDFNKINRAEFRKTLDTLKESKLIAEFMPVAIEYAYEVEEVNKLLVQSGKTDDFLDIRYNNWKKDVKMVLDAIKEAYDLDLFPFGDFNYLTMDTNELSDVITTLSRTELIYDALPIGLSVIFNLDVVKNQIGEMNIPDLKDISIEQEFDILVSMYDKFKDFKIESFEDFDFNHFLNKVLNDEHQTNMLFGLLNRVFDLQLANKLAIPAIFGYAKTNETFANMLNHAGETENFLALESEIAFKDLKAYIDVAKIALDLIDLSNYPTIEVDYFHFNPDILDSVIQKLFTTGATNKILPVGINIALSQDAIKNVLGSALDDVSFNGIDWETDFNLAIDIYREFLKFEFDSIDDFNGDKIDLLQTLLEDQDKYNTTLVILLKLVDAQLYDVAAVPSMQYLLDKFIEDKYQAFSDIVGLEGITLEQWKSDLAKILESAKLANELNVLDNLNPFDYKNLDIASDKGVSNIKTLIGNIFDLNILGNDELKTKLLVASIDQFDWVKLPDDFNIDSIVWDNEESVLLQLVDIYKSINDLDGFDIFDIENTKWVDLLESDEFLDYVVSALESAVDSSVVLELLPNILDKYLLPKLDKIQGMDDETLFSDILSKVPSEELVNEIIKLIDVVKAAAQINLLNAKDKVGEIDLSNTDALRTIVSGILDSTLVQGYEGRMIRIILKATKILDIPKDSFIYEQLISIDYTGEKDVLLKFIDKVEPVLKDPDFKLINKEGKFNLDLAFWGENQNATTLLNGVKILFGTYPNNEEVGSKLIEALIPSIYDTFIEEKDLIPNEFKDIVEELDVTNASGELLVRDIRRLLYVVEKLIEMDAHTLLNAGVMYISTPEAVEAINGILDALHDIELIRNHESETLAWGVNYLANRFKIEVDEVTDEFGNVNWLAQNEVYKDIYADIALFLRNNEIFTSRDLFVFIKSEQYNTTKFINDKNINDLLNILDRLVDVEVIDAIVPLAVKYGINVLDANSGIAADYINDFTSEELNHDFHKLIEIAHTLVDDLDMVNYYVNKFDGDLPLPNEEIVRSLVDDFFELNIIINADGKLATLIYDEIVKRVLKDDQKLIISAEDFAFNTIDWNSEKEIIREFISVGYDFLEVNNIQNMASVQQLIKDKLFASPVILRDETGYVISDAMRVLKNSQLLENVIEKLYNYGIDYLANSGKVNLPIPIDYLSGMPKDKLIEDLGTFADIFDKVVEFGLMEYLADKDIRGLDLELAAQIVEQLYKLNVIQDHDSELLGNLYNYGLKYVEDQTNGIFLLTQSQIDAIDCNQEIATLANVIRSLQSVLDLSHINSVGDVIDLINNKNYNNKEFYAKDTYNAIIDVVKCATDLQLLEVITPQLINHAKAFGETQNINLSFLNAEEYTSNLVIEDIKTILDIAKIGYDFGIIDYVFDKTLYTIETEVLCNMLDLVPSLNMANMYLDELLYQGVKYGLDKAKLNISITKEDFASISLNTEIVALKDIVRATKELLIEKSIVTLNDVKAFFNNKDYNNEAFYDIATGTILEKFVTEIADLETLQVLLPKTLNYGIDKVTKFDLTFLKNEFTKEELAQDLKLIAKLIVPAIDSEMIGLAFGKHFNDLVLHFEVYPNMLDVVQDMNILNNKYSEFVALGINEGLKAIKFDKMVKASEFEGITFKDEVVAFKEVMNSLEILALSKGYNTIGNVADALNAKVYQTVAFYDAEVGIALEKLLDSAAELETVKVMLPKALNYSVDKLTMVDLSFLKGEFTKEELAQDLKVVAKLISPAIEADLVKVLFKGNMDEIALHYDVYQEMLDIVKDINILNNKYAELIVVATNYGLDRVNSNQRVTTTMFENIKLTNEVGMLKDVIRAISVLTYDLNAQTFGDVKNIYTDLIKNNQYKDSKYSNKTVVNKLLNVINEALDVETLQALLPVASTHASDYLFQKGTDIRFLLKNVSQQELLDDAKELVFALRDLVDYGMVEFALHDGAIDIKDVSTINNAIEKIMNLNILNNNHEKAMLLLLDKLNINTKGIMLNDVNWQDEVLSLQSIVDGLKEILVMEDANTLSKIKAIEVKKYITITDDTNGYIDVFANVFKALSNDQLVERLSLAVSEKYLERLDPKYNGLLDIHNIYNNGSEFSADLASLADILLEVKKLDIFTFLVQSSDYPFSDTTVINKLIDLTLNLNYFNTNTNRLNEIIKAVDPLVKYDLSNINANGVDLRADANKLIEMYDYLVVVLTHESWPIKNKDDLKNPHIQKDFVLSSAVWQNAIDAMLKFMDTTVYDKTGAAVTILSLPLIERFAPTYYNLLELDNVSVEMMANDLELVKGLLEDLSVLDLTSIAQNGEYLTLDIKNVIHKMIDMIDSSMILKDHTNSLFEQVVNTYVNGHTIAGIYVPNGTITADGVDFVYDKEAYKGLVDELFMIFANEEIRTIEELKHFAKEIRQKSKFIEFTSSQANWQSLEKIASYLANMTMIDVNGLATINNIISPRLTGDLATIIDFSKYTNEEFMYDVDALAVLVTQLNEFNIASFMRNENINFDQAPLVKSMLDNAFSVNYIKHNLDKLVDFVDNKNVLPIQLESLKAEEFNYQDDALFIGNAYEKLLPFLTSSNNTLKTRSDIMEFIRSNFTITGALKDVVINNKYAFVDAYDELVQTTFIPLLMNEVADYAKTKLPQKYQSLIDTMNIKELTFAQKQQDILQSAVIARSLVDLGLGDVVFHKDYNFEGRVISTLNNNRVEVEKVDLITMIIDQLYPLHMLRDRLGLVNEILNTLDVDTMDIDLSTVDWDNELVQVKNIVSNSLRLLLEYDIKTVKETRNYISNLFHMTSYKDIINELKAVYNTVDLERVVHVVEAMDYSDAFDQIFKPVYNRYLYEQLPVKLKELGNLAEYSVGNLNEDMHYLATIARSLFNIKKLPGTIKENAELPECILPAQTALEALFSLNYLDLKRQDLVNFGHDLKPNLGLDTLDLSNIDFKADGKKVALYAKDILVILGQTDYFKLNISQLGNTYLMNSVVELYNGLIDTALFDVTSLWAFDTHIEPKLQNIEQFNTLTFTDERVRMIFAKTGETLDAMLDIGFFSNDGVDFTNKVHTDRLFVLLTDVFTPSNTMLKYIDKFKDNMYEIGYVKLSYEGLSTTNEISAMKDSIKAIMSFVRNYSKQLTSDYSILADSKLQTDLTNCVQNLFDSEIISQIGMPLIHGSVKILTKDITTLNILEGVRDVELIDQFLPDLYEVIHALDKLGILSKKLNYNDKDAILELARTLIYGESFKNYMDEIGKFVLCFVGINVKHTDLTDVNWDKEYIALEGALNEIGDVLKDVVISDKKTYLNNEFLSAFAKATPYFEESIFLPRVIREVADFVSSKYYGNRFDAYINKLFDVNYTDEMLMKDYMYADDIIMAIVHSDYFGNGISNTNLTPVVDLIEILFKLEYVNGMEGRILHAGFKRMELFKDYEIDFDKVVNWSDEKVAFVQSLRELVNFSNMVSLNEITPEIMKDENVQNQFVMVVDAMSNSIIGQQLLPQIYTEYIENNLGDEYAGMIDFDDPNFTPDMWASEFEKLFKGYNALVNHGFGSVDGLALTLDETIDTMTILFGTRQNSSAGIYAIVNNPEIWVKKLLNNQLVDLTDNAQLNINTTRDWLEEAYAIIDVLIEMKNFTDAAGKMDYSLVYRTTDSEKLRNLLIATNNCIALRGTIFSVIVNTMDMNAGMQEQLENLGIIDNQFFEEYALYESNPDYYNSSYWTPERITRFAEGIATVNQLLQN